MSFGLSFPSALTPKSTFVGLSSVGNGRTKQPDNCRPLLKCSQSFSPVTIRNTAPKAAIDKTGRTEKIAIREEKREEDTAAVYCGRVISKRCPLVHHGCDDGRRARRPQGRQCGRPCVTCGASVVTELHSQTARYQFLFSSAFLIAAIEEMPIAGLDVFKTLLLQAVIFFAFYYY